MLVESSTIVHKSALYTVFYIHGFHKEIVMSALLVMIMAGIPWGDLFPLFMYAYIRLCTRTCRR